MQKNRQTDDINDKEEIAKIKTHLNRRSRPQFTCAIRAAVRYLGSLYTSRSSPESSPRRWMSRPGAIRLLLLLKMDIQIRHSRQLPSPPPMRVEEGRPGSPNKVINIQYVFIHKIFGTVGNVLISTCFLAGKNLQFFPHSITFIFSHTCRHHYHQHSIVCRLSGNIHPRRSLACDKAELLLNRFGEIEFRDAMRNWDIYLLENIFANCLRGQS